MKIVSEYYKQLYASKLENLNEMNKFLERQKWQKLTQEEIYNQTDLYQIKKLDL